MKHRIWGIMSTSKLESKLHDFAMRKNKHSKAKNTVSTVFVTMETTLSHVTSWKERSNRYISKYHLLQMSWSKDINFLMSSIMQKLPDF